LATQITQLTASIGEVEDAVTAGGFFRVTSEATLAGASATIGLSVAATAGGVTEQAALLISALTGGGSQIALVAGRVVMADPDDLDNLTDPFVFESGELKLLAA